MFLLKVILLFFKKETLYKHPIKPGDSISICLFSS